jgi:hypothetical protein
MHLSATRMNVASRLLFGLTLAVVGVQLLPVGQLYSTLMPQTSGSFDQVMVSDSGQSALQAQSEGDDPDMGDREGVPPSAGSGSR